VAWVTLLPYLLSAALCPAAGRLADTHGRKRVWLLGCVLEVVSLPMAARSRTIVELLVWRAMCGAGGALSSPSGSALMLRAFPEERQSVIMGWSSMANTLAPSLGMLVGGFVADAYGWRVLFSAPVLPVAAACIAAVRVLPSDPPYRAAAVGEKPRPPFDFLGTIVLASATAALLLGVNRAGGPGGLHAAVRPLAVCAVLAPLLLAVESSAAMPILPGRVFRNVEVSLALAWRFVRNSAYMALFIIVPL
jgi:MFS family permease